MFVKPAEGQRVLRPDTRMPLAAEGEHVELDSYWRRRLRDGSIVEASAAPIAAETNEATSEPAAAHEDTAAADPSPAAATTPSTAAGNA